MADDTKKRSANLTTFMLSQDYLPEHWDDWTNAEKAALGNCEVTAKVILNRLKNAGLTVLEAYAIEHNKDEHEIWDEYKSQYIVNFTSHHIHFTCKLARGETLENIAEIIGVTPNFVEKPKAGRYAYDNMLSYLIHIKYPKKFQYDPHDVITLEGKEYIEHFREGRRRWMHGRAEKIIAETNIDLKDLKRMIMDGEITKYDLLTKPEYKYVYQLHMDIIDKLLIKHTTYIEQQEYVLRNSKHTESTV